MNSLENDAICGIRLEKNMLALQYEKHFLTQNLLVSF